MFYDWVEQCSTGCDGMLFHENIRLVVSLFVRFQEGGGQCPHTVLLLVSGARLPVNLNLNANIVERLLAQFFALSCDRGLLNTRIQHNNWAKTRLISICVVVLLWMQLISQA